MLTVYNDQYRICVYLNTYIYYAYTYATYMYIMYIPSTLYIYIYYSSLHGS